jgi:AcrR family transcriptional regulator
MTDAAPSARIAPRQQGERRDLAEARILSAATAIIADRGSASMTLAEVGEAAGYSRGLPAHYFGHKEELVRAVGVYLVGQFKSELAKRPQPRNGLDAVFNRVKAYLLSAAEDWTNHRAMMMLTIEASSLAPYLNPMMAEFSRATMAFFEENLRVAVANGEVRPCIDPSAQAVILFGAMRGIVAQAVLDPRTINLAKVHEELLETLKRSLQS